MSPPELKQQQTQKQSLQQIPQIACRLLALNRHDLRQELQYLTQQNPFLELSEATDYSNLVNYSQTQQPTLKQYLLSQLEVMPLEEQLREDCINCLDSLNERGFLPLMPELARASKLSRPRTKLALKVIRNLDPVGVGAHDLADCLMLQLEAKPDSKSKTRARNLLLNNFDMLSRGRIDMLPQDGLLTAMRFLRSLQPSFANNFATAATYLLPDLEVFNAKGIFKVRFFEQDQFVTLRKYDHQPARNQQNYHWHKLEREAKAIISAVNFRNSSVLKIAQALVDRQRSYFIIGKQGLAPVGLRDLAMDTGLSLSTISTTIRDKSLAYIGKIITLKYLLQRRTAGGKISGAALQEAIREIVQQEDAANPMSDTEIMERLLPEHGSPKRRTVAKHRQLAGIPPAHIRKQFKYADFNHSKTF